MKQILTHGQVDVDRLSITSPENIQETRQRLSKLLSRDKGQRNDGHQHIQSSSEFEQTEDMKAFSRSKATATMEHFQQTVIRHRSPHRGIGDNAGLDIPIRVTPNRIRQTSAGSLRYSLPEAHSHKQLGSQSGGRRKSADDFDFGSSTASIDLLDSDRIARCVGAWKREAVRSVSSAVNVLDIIFRVQRVSQMLTALHVSNIQLWLRRDLDEDHSHEHGARDSSRTLSNNLWNRSSDNTHWNAIPDSLVDYILDYGINDGGSDGGNHLRVYPSDAMWSQFVSNVALQGGFESGGQNTGVSHRNPHLFWHCIHIIPLPFFSSKTVEANTNQSATSSLPFGYFVFTEIMDNSATSQVSLLQQSHQSQATVVKVLLACECVSELAVSIVLRLSEISSARQSAASGKEAAQVSSSQIQYLKFSKYSLDVLAGSNMRDACCSCCEALLDITKASSCAAIVFDPTGNHVVMAGSSVAQSQRESPAFPNGIFASVFQSVAMDNDDGQSISHATTAATSTMPQQLLMELCNKRGRGSTPMLRTRESFLGVDVEYTTEKQLLELGLSVCDFNNSKFDDSLDDTQLNTRVPYILLHSAQISVSNNSPSDCGPNFLLVIILFLHPSQHDSGEGADAQSQQMFRWVDLIKLHTVSKLHQFLRIEELQYVAEVSCLHESITRQCQRLNPADDGYSTEHIFRAVAAHTAAMKKSFHCDEVRLIMFPKSVGIEDEQESLSAHAICFLDSHTDALKIVDVSVPQSAAVTGRDIMCPWWRNEVNKGNAVFYSPSNRGQCTSQNGSITNQCDSLGVLFREFRLEHSSTLALVPLVFNTDICSCLLLLAGKVPRVFGGSQEASRASFSFPRTLLEFTNDDVQLVQRSGLPHVVGRFLQALNAQLDVRRLQGEVNRSLGKLENLGAALFVRQAWKATATAFGKWRTLCVQRQERQQKEFALNMLVCIKAALSKDMEQLKSCAKPIPFASEWKYICVDEGLVRSYLAQIHDWRLSRRRGLLTILESYVARLFSNDVVTTLVDGASSHQSESVWTEAEGNKDVLLGKVLGVDINPALWSSSIEEIAFDTHHHHHHHHHHRHSSHSTPSFHSHTRFIETSAVPAPSFETHLLGIVKVTRLRGGVKVSSGFKPFECNMVRDLCDLLGSVYSSVGMSTHTFPPYSLCNTTDSEHQHRHDTMQSRFEADIKELQQRNEQLASSLQALNGAGAESSEIGLLPAFLKMVPLILSSFLNEGVSALVSQLPLLIRGLKGIVRSDLVLLRIFGNHSTGLTSDVVLSSEDAIRQPVASQSRSGKQRRASDGQREPSLKSNIEDLVLRLGQSDLSVSSDDGSSVEFDDSSDGDQFCYKLRSARMAGIHSNNTHTNAFDQQQVLAELRIVGVDSSSDLSTEKMIVEMLAYVLAHVMSTTRRLELLQSDNERSKQAIVEFEKLNHAATSELHSIKSGAQATAEKLAAAHGYIEFLSQCTRTGTVLQLSRLIAQTLPAVLNIARATLLELKVSDGDHGKQEFYDVVDVQHSAREFESSDDHISQRMMSGTYLRTLPTFPEVSVLPGMPSKLFFKKSSQSSQQHYCLLIQCEDNNDQRIGERSSKSSNMVLQGVWSGKEELIIDSIGSCLLNCSTKEDIHRSVETVKAQLHAIDAVQADRTRLGEEMRRTQTQVISLTASNESLIQEVQTLRQQLAHSESERERAISSGRSEIEELLRAKQEIEREFVQKMDSMNKHIDSTEEEKHSTEKSKHKLLDIVRSFGSDRRIGSGRVLEWLGDYAEVANARIEFVSQEEDGKLGGSQHQEGWFGLDRIRGVVAAAGECIRTGNCASFVASLSARSNVFQNSNALPSRSSRISHRDASEAFGNARHDEQQVKMGVLCVPNMSIIPGRASPHACVVFIQSGGHLVGEEEEFRGFNEIDQEMLRTAATLAFTVLTREASSLSPLQFQKLEANIEAEQQRLRRIRGAVRVCEQAWGRGVKTQDDLIQTMESCGVTLLNRTTQGVAVDPCTVEAFFWCPTVKGGISSNGGAEIIDPISSTLAQRGLGNEVDIVRKLFATGQSWRQLGIIWLPMKSPTGEVLAVLRLERKLAVSDHINDPKLGGVKLQHGHDISSLLVAPTINDLIITDEDEEILRLFCRMSFPLIDRLACTHDAFTTVRQASQAIAVLQNTQQVVENRLANEITHRMQIEEAVKAGLSLLQLAAGHRVSTLQLMEAARLAVVNITNSEECYVLFPNAEQHPSKGESERKISDANSSSDDEVENESDRRLVSFEPNRRELIRARLGLGDLEALCLQHGRVLVSPMQADDVAIASHRDSEQQSTHNVTVLCPSWTARRAFRNTKYSGTKSAISEAKSIGRSNGAFSIAVPWTWPLHHVLKEPIGESCSNHSQAALITATRRTLSYSSLEQDAILWISQVLAHCLALSTVDDCRRQLHTVVQGTQAELKKYKSESALRISIEESLSGFYDVLGSIEEPSHDSATETPSHNLSLEDRILSAAKFVFGADHIHLLFATRADMPLGTDLLNPPRREVSPKQSSTSGGGMDTKAMTVKSKFGQLEGWVEDGESAESDDSDSDDQIVSSRRKPRLDMKSNLTSSIAKLQFLYQLSNVRRSGDHSSPSEAAGGVAVEAPEVSSFVSQTTDLFQGHSRPAVMLLIKFHDRQQAVLLRVFPSTYQGDSAAPKLDTVWRLRAKLLLRLVDSEVPWISALQAKAEETHALIAQVHDLQRQVAASQQNQDQVLQEAMAANEEQVLACKERYRSLLKERSRIYTLGEILHVAGFAAGASFHARLMEWVQQRRLIPATAGEAREAVKDGLQALCSSMVKFTNCTLKIGIGYADPDANDSNITSESTLEWVDIDLHGRIHSSHAPQSSSHQQRNDGAGIELALQSGCVVVVSALPDDGTIQRAEEYSQKLFHQTGQSEGFKRVQAQTAIVTATAACGYPVGTVLIPIVLRSLSLRAVIVSLPGSPSDAQTAHQTHAHVRSHSSVDKLASADESKHSSTMLATQLTTWMMLSHQVKLTVFEVTNFHTNHPNHVELALLKLFSVFSRRKAGDGELRAAFHRLQVHRLQEQCMRGVVVEQKLATARTTIGRLEQSSADWMELVKGINGSGVGLLEGREGLWGHSCRILMNLIGSHMEIHGCGLFIRSNRRTEKDRIKLEGVHASDSDEYSVDDSQVHQQHLSEDIIELTVRELSTPFHDRSSATSSSDAPKYSKGVLESRVVGDYGHQITSIVISLLRLSADDQEETISNPLLHGLHTHRLIKLRKHSRDHTLHSGQSTYSIVGHHHHHLHGRGQHGIPQPAATDDNEEIWLIPVRSRKEVLGVLRVSLTVDKPSARSEKAAVSVSPSTKMLPKSPRRAPPLPPAAQNRIAHRPTSDPITSDSEPALEIPLSSVAVAAATDDTKTPSDFAQDICIQFAELWAPLLYAATDVEQSREAKEQARAMQVRKMDAVDRISQEMEYVTENTLLLTAAFDVVVKHQTAASSENSSPNVALGSTHTSFATQALLSQVSLARVFSKLLGTALHADVVIILKRDDNSSDSDGEHHHHSSGKHIPQHHPPSRTQLYSKFACSLVNSANSIVGSIEIRGNDCLVGFLNNAPDMNHTRTSQLETVSEHHKPKVGESIMRALTVLLAERLSDVHNESDAKVKVELAAKTLQKIETALEERNSQVNDLIASESMLQRSAALYRSLAEMGHQSLLFAARSNCRRPSMLDSDEQAIRPNIGLYLQDLCYKLPSLIGGRCMFAFAVPVLVQDRLEQLGLNLADDDAPAIDVETRAALKWYAVREGDLERHIIELDPHTRSVALNLAHAAMASGEKSFIDVSNSNSTVGFKPLPSERGALDVLSSRSVIETNIDVASSSASVGVVKILTWPLQRPTTGITGTTTKTADAGNRVIGVLQAILPAATDAVDVEGFCSDVAAAAGAVLHLCNEWEAVTSSLASMEQELVLLETAHEGHDRHVASNSQQLQLWEGLAQLLAELCTRASVLGTDSFGSGLETGELGAEVATASKPFILQLLESTQISNLLSRLGFAFKYANAEKIEIVFEDSNVQIDHQLDSLKENVLRLLNDACNAIVAVQHVQSRKVVECSQKTALALRKIEKLKIELNDGKARLNEEFQKREGLIRQLAQMDTQIPAIVEQSSASFDAVVSVLAEELVAFVADDILGTGNAQSNSSSDETDTLCKSIVNTAGGYLSRLAQTQLPFHLTLFVETGVDGNQLQQFKVFTTDSTRHTAPRRFIQFAEHNNSSSSSNAAKVLNMNLNLSTNADIDGFGLSAIEKCFLTGHIVEETVVTHSNSFVGASRATLAEIFESDTRHGQHAHDSQHQGNLIELSGIFVPVASGTSSRIMMRVLYSGTEKSSQPQTLASAHVCTPSVLRAALQMVAVVCSLLLRMQKLRTELANTTAIAAATASRFTSEAALSKSQLQRALRLCRVVSREASVLLDSPVVNMNTLNTSGGSSTSFAASPAGGGRGRDRDRGRLDTSIASLQALHPASLPPAVASQDIALKVLGLVRTLLRSEGQALLLKDLATDPVSYQVICAGSALSWPGIQPGVFGVVSMPRDNSNPMHNSLVEYVMRGHKSLVVADATRDARYAAALDGTCAPRSPLVLCPVRGRGGAVVGVLIAARGQGASAFVGEDVAALELTAALASLSLYWCQGLGTLHNKLVRSASKMNQIEHAVDALRKGK